MSAPASGPRPSQPVPVSEIIESDPKCEQCQTTETVIHDRKNGNMVCTRCGLVVEARVISDETEWRTFENDDKGKGDPNRVGGPEDPLLGAAQLGTIIGADVGDNNLTRYNRSAGASSEDRALINAFSRITKLAGQLSLPKLIVDRAKEMYKRVDDSKEFKNRRSDAVITACVYIACRQSRVDRTIKELCAVSDVKRRDVGRCFSKIKQLKIYKKGDARSRDASSLGLSPANLIDRYASHLGIPTNVATIARHVAERVSELGVATGRNPATLAGASIFLVTSLLGGASEKSIDDVAEVSRMKPTTIRQAHRLLLERKSELLPQDFVGNGLGAINSVTIADSNSKRGASSAPSAPTAAASSSSSSRPVAAPSYVSFSAAPSSFSYPPAPSAPTPSTFSGLYGSTPPSLE